MVKKLTSFSIVLNCITSLIFGQNNETIRPIPSVQIFINGINNNADISQCKKVFGEPIKFEKRTYELGPDGLDEGYTLNYDSLKITYIKYYGNIIMSNLSVKGGRFKIQLLNCTFSIGDPISKLDFLLNSNFSCEEKKKDQNGNIIKLIFDMVTIRNSSQCDGSISIEIEGGRIKRVGLVFDEDLT